MMELQRDNVERLTHEIAGAIREHYLTHENPEADRAKVFEVLNALAVSTATVLRGTGCSTEAMLFFSMALQQNMADDDRPPGGFHG